MSEFNDHETSIYGAYGEFEGYDQTSEWTDEDWAEYDAYVSQDIADWEAQCSTEDFYLDFDAEPPF